MSTTLICNRATVLLVLLCLTASSLPIPVSAQGEKPQSAASTLTTEQKAELDTLNTQARQAYGKGDLSVAETLFQQGLAHATALKDESYTARFLNGLSAVYYSLGQYEKALDYLSRALTLREKIGNPQEIATTLNNLGAIYNSLGQQEKALDYYTRALTLKEKIGDPQQIASTLESLGTVYNLLSQYDKALDYYQRALELWKKIGTPQDIAMSLNDLGTVYVSLSRFDKALDYYQQALALKEKLGNPLDIAISLNNLGTVYNSLSQYDKATAYYQQALALREKIVPDSLNIATVLHNLGAVQFARGDLAKALAYHQRALAIQERLAPNSPDIAGTLINLAQIARSRGDGVTAAEMEDRARKIKGDIALQRPSDLWILCVGGSGTNRQQSAAIQEQTKAVGAALKKLGTGRRFAAVHLYSLAGLLMDRRSLAKVTDRIAHLAKQEDVLIVYDRSGADMPSPRLGATPHENLGAILAQIPARRRMVFVDEVFTRGTFQDLAHHLLRDRDALELGGYQCVLYGVGGSRERFAGTRMPPLGRVLLRIMGQIDLQYGLKVTTTADFRELVARRLAEDSNRRYRLETATVGIEFKIGNTEAVSASLQRRHVASAVRRAFVPMVPEGTDRMVPTGWRNRCQHRTQEHKKSASDGHPQSRKQGSSLQKPDTDTLTPDRGTGLATQVSLQGLSLGKSYALIFATDHYVNWPELKNPGSDATAIARDLTQIYGFQSKVVLDPDYATVLKELKSYMQMHFSPTDHLLVFFAGHGDFDEDFKQGYLIFHDSAHDSVRGRCLPYVMLSNILDRLPCNHVLVMIDACYGGTFDEHIASRGEDYEEPSIDEFVRRKLQYRTRKFLASGAKEYVSDGKGGHSPFALRVMEALRSGGGKDGVLTWAKLQDHVEHLKPVPVGGDFGSAEPSSDFLFVAKSHSGK